MKILTILPVSRIQYLNYVLDSLLNQSYKGHTALLVVVDGSNDLFVRVRNIIASTSLNDVLCVQSLNGGDAAFTIPQRRQRITNIHNQIRTLIGDDIEWIFSIEDDGVLPINALSWLVNDVQSYPNAGLVTGVELGRWGIPYVGAWRADDVNNPQKITSMASKAGTSAVEEIDACGLYCALIRADLYKQHEFTCANGLGPDINLALELRQCGFNNYIDWFVPVTHITEKMGQTVQIPATNKALVINLTPLGDSTTWHAAP
jgi:glycosyltransferase involved in cell wall biosynthesis